MKRVRLAVGVVGWVLLCVWLLWPEEELAPEPDSTGPVASADEENDVPEPRVRRRDRPQREVADDPSDTREEVEEPPEVPDGFVRAQVRSAADGRPLPGFELAVVRKGADAEPETLTTDADGWVVVPDRARLRQQRSRLAPADRAWFGASTSLALREGEVLWVARRVRVEGRVVGEHGDTLPAEVVQVGTVRLRYLGVPGETHRMDRGRSHWVPHVKDVVREAAVDGQGRFRLVTALTPDYGVTASGIVGYRVESVRLPARTDEGVVRLELRVRPQRRITGRIVDADGRAVADAALHATAILSVPPSEAGSVEFLHAGGGCAVSGGAERYDFMWQRQGRSAEDGTFSLTHDVDYRVVLVAMHPRYGTAVTHVVAGAEPDDLILRFGHARAAPRVTVRHGDEVVRGLRLRVMDLEESPIQLTALQATLDEQGRFSAGALQPGRHYRLTVIDPLPSADGQVFVQSDFEWTGQTEIHLPVSE